MSNFSLLILSAGYGTRMLDLTKNTPKPLLKFRNTTLLDNTISFFTDIGCNEIFINTHYLHKNIELYVKKNFHKRPVYTIYEPLILGTGGGVKNIFNFTKSKKICVVNSDIFWQSNNKIDIKNFLKDFNKVNHCKILLSNKKNFYGLKKLNGDFNINNGIISDWNKDNEVYYYSGLQIVSRNIFQNTETNFSINDIWNKLILEKKLKGELIKSNILHIGDKNSFNKL